MSNTFLQKISLAALATLAMSMPALSAAQDIILLNKDGEEVGVAKEEKAPPRVVVVDKAAEPGKPGVSSATMANGVITITRADGTTEEINLADARSVTIARSSQLVDENGERKMKSVSKAILIGPDGVRREITLGDNPGGDPVRTVETPKTWMIGLNCQPVSELVRAQLKLGENTGLAVTRVLEGGASKTGGVQVHDILLFVDQTTLSTNRQLTDAVNEAGRNGHTLSLTLLRAGEEMSVSVEPAEREGMKQMMLEIGPEGLGGFGGDRGFFVPEMPDFDMEFRRLGPGLILGDGLKLPRPEGMKEMTERLERMQQEMRQEMEELRNRVLEGDK